MMGWIALFALAALAFAALWKSGRCSRLALEISGAALLLGVAGYAWQGEPAMAGKPIAPAQP